MATGRHLSDWDRLFSANAPRRRGPLGLILVWSLLFLLVGLYTFAGVLGIRVVRQARELKQATREAALVAEQKAAAEAAAAQPAPAPVTAPPAPALPTATVAVLANVRSAPDLAPGTVVGQVMAGDVVGVVENREVAGNVWYRVRVMQTGGVLAQGTEGWIAASLLSMPDTVAPAGSDVNSSTP